MQTYVFPIALLGFQGVYLTSGLAVHQIYIVQTIPFSLAQSVNF